MLLVPILGFNRKDDVSALEKRTLAAKPEFDWKSFAAWDSYFQDRFGGRDGLVTFGNWFDYQILHRSLHTVRALGGRNGWLFYIVPTDGNNLADFNKENLLDMEQLKRLEKRIQSLVEWCDANDLKYLFVVAPNKHTVYPEYYPYKRPPGITCLEQIEEIFQSLGILLVNPLDMLLEMKKQEDFPLYYETDTHWNPIGAYYASLMVKREIEKLFPNIEFPEWHKNVEVGYSDTLGDIIPLLGLQKAKSTRPVVKDGTHLYTDFFSVQKSDVPRRFHTVSKNENLPTAIVFRDSFGTALVPYLSTLFSRADYNWKFFSDDDKSYVLQEKPDIVVFEVAERYAMSIAGK